MTASKTGTDDASPRTPRAARRSRTTAGAKALLAVAAERTGDAPTAEPAETAPELTWYPTIGHVVEAKFRRWQEARPKPLPAPVRDEDLPPPPPLPRSPQPVGLTPADGEFLAKLDAAISTTQREIEQGTMRAVEDINEIHRQHHPLFAEPRTPIPAETAPAPPAAAPEQSHDTGPHPWLDTLERELAPDSPPEPPPPAEDHGQVSDDTGTWLQTLPWTSDVDSEAPADD